MSGNPERKPGALAQALHSPAAMLALALALSAEAWASKGGPSAGEQNGTSAPPRPISTPSSLPSADEISAQFEKMDREISSLSFHFSQKVLMQETGITQGVEGNLQYLKPNLIRIEHQKPKEQVVVTDKKSIWAYTPENRQVIRMGWDHWMKTQASVTGLMDFGNYSQLFKNHSVFIDSVTVDSSPYLRVAFIPKTDAKGEASPDYKLTLFLSLADFFPARIHLVVGGISVQTSLEHVVRNPALKKEIFDFKQPPGTEVLDFR